MRRFSTKVVGLTFQPGYPGNLLALQRCEYGVRGRPVPKLRLVADDDNQYDDQAVMVLIDMEPELAEEEGIRSFQVGHLPARVSGRIRPELEEWAIDSWTVNVVPSRPDQPGIEIVCVRGDG